LVTYHQSHLEITLSIRHEYYLNDSPFLIYSRLVTTSQRKPLTLEKRLFEIESKTLIILGIDEVGRGALAGPIVAACVLITAKDEQHPDVRDSKKCSAKERATLSAWIHKHHPVHISAMSASEIDRWGISFCNQEVMRRSALAHKLDQKNPMIKTLIDGRLKFKLPMSYHAEWIIKGDAISYAIAAASIVAKFYRDSLMEKLSSQFPLYGLEAHKGYGTQKHLTQLKSKGLTSIHRKTFCQNLFREQSSLI
jgi:ribonuclease HII